MAIVFLGAFGASASDSGRILAAKSVGRHFYTLINEACRQNWAVKNLPRAHCVCWRRSLIMKQ